MPRSEPEQEGIELQNLAPNPTITEERTNDDIPRTNILPPYAEVDPNPLNRQSFGPRFEDQYKKMEKEIYNRIGWALVPFLWLMC